MLVILEFQLDCRNLHQDESFGEKKINLLYSLFCSAVFFAFVNPEYLQKSVHIMVKINVAKTGNFCRKKVKN